MNSDEPTGKRRPHEQHAQHRDERHPAPEPRSDRPDSKPGKDKQGDWRGAGVCGDRHTD